ncbi:hypothetical protein [Staphylococcus aureus]|uniref:hypothetical protein n=1 Tax=Staphylococcus aureus TaxID=1280 RepID=UPI0021CBA4EF|nr:hypothetical protein [Staphylococcus aureus]
MLILKIKEINDKSVTYKYFPNNDDNYFIHAIDRIYINASKGLFPESELVAWG